MWASKFQPAKERQPSNHNAFNDILIMIKDILVVANDFLKLKVLDVLIDFLDRFTEANQNEPSPH